MSVDHYANRRQRLLAQLVDQLLAAEAAQDRAPTQAGEQAVERARVAIYEACRPGQSRDASTLAELSAD